MAKLFINNYLKILRKLPSPSAIQPSKSLVILGLLFYWVAILVGTFLNFN